MGRSGWGERDGEDGDGDNGMGARDGELDEESGIGEGEGSNLRLVYFAPLFTRLACGTGWLTCPGKSDTL